MKTGETSSLFSPAGFGSLRLKNRLVRSATAEQLASEPVGRATPALVTMYKELARGGVGLIITGHAFVSPLGKAHSEMLGIHCDELIPGLRLLTDAVHDEGSAIAVQIQHGGRQSDRACVPEVIAPSAVPMHDGSRAREMSQAEILDTIEAFGQAALRAKLAGFDAVQVHAAHGYLISEFLSPHSNRRGDAWGGDFERRLAFLEAVCEAVRGRVGRDYPVFVKLGMMDNIEQVPGGLRPADGARIVARLEEFGLDAVEVSGAYDGPTRFNVRMGVGRKVPEAYFRHLAQMAKAATRLPVMLVGGLRSRTVMDDVLASGDADFISLCRPLIREPDLPNRLRMGEASVAACISGGRCWADGPGQGIGCRCES